MPDLKYWQQKIQDKRKQTDFRDFLMEFASWSPVIFHRNNGQVSRYHSKSFIQVCSPKDFNEHKDFLIQKTGREYQPDKDFFVQLKELWMNMTMPSMFHYGNVENVDFCDTAVNSRNAYLSNIVTIDSENILYTMRASLSSDILNSLFIVSSQQVFYSHQVHASYKIFYSRFIQNSNNIWLSSNLTGCHECIACHDLENTQYCIQNIAYSQEEYFKKKSEILKAKDTFSDMYQGVDTVGRNIASTNVSGTSIIESENIENGNFVLQTKNGRNLYYIGGEDPLQDCYDFFSGGGAGNNDYYGVSSSGGSSHIYCSVSVGYSSNIFYSYYMYECSYCFGCIGLSNKQYCILNQQYTKDEWYKKVDEICMHMYEGGTLGDFFPPTMNPFYFNDTTAALFNIFTKEEVESQGYMWRHEEIKVDIPEGSKVIQTTELDSYQGYDENGEWKIDPEILGVVIQDEKGNYYRIVQMEYNFLMKHALPLPEIHWMDRMKLNFGV